MPGRDRTGPFGSGPRAGGGFGLCRAADTGRVCGWSRWIRGVGRGGIPCGGGRGRCFGGGRGRFPFSWLRSISPAEETEALRAEIAAARDMIAELEERLEGFQSKE